MKSCFTNFFVALLLLISTVILAQEDGGKRLRVNRKNPIVKTRIGISPVVGLYFTNKNHTSKPRPKMAYSISLKEEIRINKKNTDFIFIGIDYLFHGVNFNSYYFYKDSLQLYTPNRMNYKYSLTFHEIDFPIQIKHSFDIENNCIFSGYVYAGYCYRWLIASNLKVSDNGNEIENKSERVTFKSPAFNPSNSSFLSVGAGFQKNTPMKHNAVFAEFQFKYALSRMQFKESFAPSNMYVNGHFIYITVGVKF